eukprot:4234011-Pleurochrysis_carterae.AAC.1
MKYCTPSEHQPRSAGGSEQRLLIENLLLLRLRPNAEIISETDAVAANNKIEFLPYFPIKEMIKGNFPTF